MPINARRRIGWSCALGALLTLCGCAQNPAKPDPLEKANRFFYGFNDGLDRFALKPASDCYVKVIPKFVRTGLGNAFDNLGYGNVIVNDFLQGKCGQGLGDLGRMAVNTTIGVAGIFDVAATHGLPAHENDFGITLGKWGSGPGPYLVLPLLGPSSGRDAPGIGVAMVTNPIFWIDPPDAVNIPLTGVQVVQGRSEADAEIRFRNQAAIDPYVFTRDAYLQHRQAKIRGSAPAPDEGFYDQDTETASPPANPATSQKSVAPAPAPGYGESDLNSSQPGR